MASIFISYRRADAGRTATKLFRTLKAALPGHSVFLDEGGGLRPSEDFIDRLGEEVAKADVFLAIIGPQWLTARGHDGRPRLTDPEDILRREIELALKTTRTRIIPVLVDGATMPRAEDLPSEMQLLTRRHAQRLATKGWSKSVGALTNRIRELIKEKVEEDEQALTELAAPNAKLEVLSLHPGAVGEEFADMPIFGRWRIEVTAPTAPHPIVGPAGRQTLLLTLNDDWSLVGQARVHRTGLGKILGPRRFTLDGTWSLGLWDKGGLLLKLSLVVDRVREVKLKIPVGKRAGRGYFAQDEDGLTFWLTSLGGRPSGPRRL